VKLYSKSLTKDSYIAELCFQEFSSLCFQKFSSFNCHLIAQFPVEFSMELSQKACDFHKLMTFPAVLRICLPMIRCNVVHNSQALVKRLVLEMLLKRSNAIWLCKSVFDEVVFFISKQQLDINCSIHGL
jgi:hypothetical protein